ncbi:MAG TPA: polysaccharide deacetylase family protein [Bacteroidia bacterium]
MRYSPAIHDARHLIKNFLGNAGQLLGNNMLPPADCLVLNYHGTQKKFIRNFEYQLKWLNDHFHIGTPRDLFDYYERKKTGDRTMVVLTFDDGIKNNLYAVEAMARSGIKAFFFVVPGFIETASQKDFFLRNIRPVINPEIDSAKEDFEALSWHELMGLSKEGHHIGSHTSTHTLVAGSGDASHEIEDSKTAIENAISTRVSTFCSPNNTLTSLGASEMKLIKKNYAYHFSTLPGSNMKAEPYFIRRSNAEAHWMKGAFLNAIGKWDRRRWRRRESEFRKLLSS